MHYQFPLSIWPKLETITLTDGRKLSFRRIGSPQGKPALFFHGTPGSHTLGFVAEETALAAGYQLISPDRPGIGGSDFQENRELRHWSLDVVQLLHQLGIKKCPIVAISGGAPYALQCAYDLPQHITQLALLSGWLSYDRMEADGIKLSGAINTLRLVYKTRIGVAPVAKLTEYLVREKPYKLLAQLKKDMPLQDLALLEDAALRDLFLYDLQNGYAQGWHGPAADGALQFGNQPFPLRAVEQPVLLVHGTDDNVAPYAMAEAMNRHLPKIIDFLTVPEGGHLCAVPLTAQIFAKLNNL